MTDGNGSWERDLVTKLASEALKEQRRRRRWGIFFKLLTFAYITFILVLALDWSSRGDFTSGKKHTAMVELSGIIAPGTDAMASISASTTSRRRPSEKLGTHSTRRAMVRGSP